jgi:hypothetical protein
MANYNKKFYKKILVTPDSKQNVKTINNKQIESKDINEPTININQPNKIKALSSYKKIGKVSPIFKGETVYLIGGGPSLKEFDFTLLEGKNVIAINKAFLYYKNADVLYWTDNRFYTWFQKEIDLFKGIKVTNKNTPLKDDVTNLRDTGKIGLETKPDSIRHGNNSGYAAINLAFLMGAKTIILLGFDMGILHGQSHFHKGYNIKANPNIYKNNMIPFFNTLVDPLKEHNVKIWNTNKNSNLKCFPFCTINEGLNF